jgi:hypothetical protein
VLGELQIQKHAEAMNFLVRLEIWKFVLCKPLARGISKSPH